MNEYDVIVTETVISQWKVRVTGVDESDARWHAERKCLQHGRQIGRQKIRVKIDSVLALPKEVKP